MSPPSPGPTGLPAPDSNKEARFQRVAAAVLRVIRLHGPEGLRYATVASRAGVSRAWLYKYFGKDRDALIAHAALTFGDAFIGQSRVLVAPDPEAWRGAIAEGTAQGLADTERMPWLIELWFRYRHRPGVAGDAVREVEARHVAKFVEEMPASLRRDRAAAETFAVLFANARLGVYHRWIDASFRQSAGVEGTVVGLMGMVDGFIARAGPG